MGNHSVVEHRSGYYFIRIEEDMLAICSKGECSPHCKALILAILEHWMNTKRGKDESEYVYLTMPQWIKHTYMLYKRNVITDCIRELMTENLIKRRPIKVHDQNTFEYTLNLDVLNNRIKKLPAKPLKETQPNLEDYLAFEDRAKAKRTKIKQDEEEVGEKSPTVRGKSPEVGEKPTQHSIPTQIPNLDSTRESSQHGQNPTNKPALSSSTQKNMTFLSWEHLSVEERTIIEHWQTIVGYAAPLTKEIAAAAKELVRCQATKDDLIAVRAFCLRTNPKWYQEKGIDLATIARNWSKWKSTQQPLASSSAPTAPTGGMSQDEAQTVAQDAVAKGKQYGYDIKAQAVCEQGVWLVKLDWDGDALTMHSPAEWNKEFAEIHEMEQNILKIKQQVALKEAK